MWGAPKCCKRRFAIKNRQLLVIGAARDRATDLAAASER
jgi:hypothetical protein